MASDKEYRDLFVEETRRDEASARGRRWRQAARRALTRIEG